MLEGGENYLATTENRLETADCVAVLWLQASVASHWVRDEAQRGHERGCLVPLSLDGTMALLGFRQCPLLDISGWPGDPDDALAAIANTASSAGEVRTLYSQAIAAAQHAIALEGRLAQGHLALGFALNNGELKRAEAMVHYRAAEKLAPGDADALRQVATFYSFGTERDVASQMIARVIELDPLNARVYRSAGFIALFARDYSAAISQMQRALEINPSLASAQFVIANARLMQGDAAGAPTAAKAERVPQFALTMTAFAADRLGDTVEADVAYAKRDSGMLLAPNDPMLDPLRGEPKLEELLSRLAS